MKHFTTLRDSVRNDLFKESDSSSHITRVTEEAKEKQEQEQYRPESSDDDLLVRKRFTWSPELENVLIEQFGDTSCEMLHVTLVRKIASETPELRGISAKQIYDKLQQLKRTEKFDGGE